MFGCSCVGRMLIGVIPSPCVDPSIIFFMAFVVSDMNIATPALLSCVPFFPPLSFSLCVFFALKWVSLSPLSGCTSGLWDLSFLTRDQTCAHGRVPATGLLFPTPYLLIGAFSSLTFKVIIDRYVFIAILILVLLLSSYFFSVLSFFLFWFDDFLLLCLCSFFVFCESVVCFWFVVSSMLTHYYDISLL